MIDCPEQTDIHLKNRITSDIIMILPFSLIKEQTPHLGGGGLILQELQYLNPVIPF